MADAERKLSNGATRIEFETDPARYRHWKLKVDGDVGNKKVYDPRNYLKKAEASMTERVIEACNDLHCAGKSVGA